MPKQNPYYTKDITKLPETATISYYNAETDQNLSAEEWNRLNPAINPSEVRIINQGEVYQSWKIDADNSAYGPGFWDEIGVPILKFTGKAVATTFIAGSIIASGGATAPLLLATGAVGAGTGKIIKEVAKHEEIEWLECAGDIICDTGVDVLTGTLAGKHKGFKSLVTFIGESSDVVKEFQSMYNTWDSVKDIKAAEFHIKHVNAGIKYHGWCGVCN